MNKPTVLKILLIEDNPGDARLVQEAVRETDASRVGFAHCTSLAAAVQHLKTEEVNLILLDLGLPDASGLEALAELEHVVPRTPVIVLTGNDDDATAIEALRRGAQDHLVKGSVNGESLMRSARYALERQRTVDLRAGLLKGVARQLETPVDALLASVQDLVELDRAKLTERQIGMLERMLQTAQQLRNFHRGMSELASNEVDRSSPHAAGVAAEIQGCMARAVEAATPAPESKRTPPPASDSPLRVLILEDNPADARLLQEVLAESSLHFDATLSSSLMDSVRRLESEVYDVAFVDLGLPDSSALESVSEVARLASRSAIIVLTGRDDDNAALESLNKGAQDYLIKGRVDAAVLMRSIRFARERQRTINVRAELLEATAGELCNPVHVLLGYTHLLLETVTDPLTPEQTQSLKNVLTMTRTLRRLSEAMLDLAGAKTGPARDELRNAGAVEVVEQLKRRMTHLLAVGGDREPALAKVIVAKPDAGLLRRVFQRFSKQPKQILLIDPDYDSRTIIRTALESGSFEVVEACKEAEVLDHLTSDKVALAVFERQTPELGAPEVFAHIKRVATHCEIPILLLGEEQTGGRAENRITKPFTPEQLLFAVGHALGRA